jgi:hypothetical protein
MPEAINSSEINTSEMVVASNSVSNMVEGGGFGPDQATVRIISMSYISTDFNNTVNPKVFVAQAIFSPLDGSNDNKDFETQWSIGAVNEKEAAILNNGGTIGFTPSSGKTALKNNTNFADFQKSIKDGPFNWNDAVLDGPTGIHIMEGYEMVIKKIPQRTREGMSDKNEKGYAKTMYTCLKLTSQPGESKLVRAGAAKAKPATTTAATKPTAAVHAKTPPASSNGSGSHDVIGAVKQILTDAANTSSLKDLQLSAFRHFKDGGMAVGEAQALARTIDEKFIDANSMEHGLDIAGTGKEAIITLTV